MPRAHDPYRSPPNRYGDTGKQPARAKYEAADLADTYRKKRREPGSANTAVGRAGPHLRQLARSAEQNHDLARGILAVLTANIAGPKGIGIEPQPRRADGSIHADVAEQIRRLHRDWARRPEVTWRHTWPRVQHLLVRTWLRDGEALAHLVQGRLSDVRHGSRIPLSLELLEADYLPLDLSDPGRRLVQGVEHDRWGRPTRYHLYREHPGDVDTAFLATHAALRVVRADNIAHLALTERLHQVRGVSIFASVLERLEDLKEYEEFERVAAKVAASMAAYIKKSTPDAYNPATLPKDKLDRHGNPLPRRLQFKPGMVFDDLYAGEDIGVIDTSRPNTSLGIHRQNQLRAIASGTAVTYSSAAKDYDGSYSSQRQEMVEGWSVYGMLQEHFIGQLIRPVHERLISVALAAGALRLPADVDPDTLDDALYIPPQQPWIDPDKESRAFERLEANVHASGPEIIRRRGQSPSDVLEQQVRWERELQRVRELRPDSQTAATEATPRAARNRVTDMRPD